MCSATQAPAQQSGPFCREAGRARGNGADLSRGSTRRPGPGPDSRSDAVTGDAGCGPSRKDEGSQATSLPVPSLRSANLAVLPFCGPASSSVKRGEHTTLLCGAAWPACWAHGRALPQHGGPGQSPSPSSLCPPICKTGQKQGLLPGTVMS